MDFRDINWGDDEARGDRNLSSYFIEIPEMSSLLSGGKRYVIGRKGSGKTAIAEKIRIDSESRHDWFYEDISLKDFPVSDFRDLGDNSYRDKSKFVEAWKFVIILALVRMIHKDESCCEQRPSLQLAKFLNDNFPSDDVGISKCISVLRNNRLKLSVKNLFEGESGSSKTCTTDIHFHKVTRTLLERIGEIQSDNTYFIFFDELDEGYNPKDGNLRLMLLALIRAIENLTKDFSDASFQFRPVLMLRSDIFSRLDDNDLNKIDDYIIFIDWSVYNGAKCSLEGLVQARISATLGSNTTWRGIVDDEDTKLPHYIGSCWKYILYRTYERPRDIVKFMKYCSKSCKPGLLTFEQIERAENDYSKWLFRELRDEVYAHLSCFSDAVMSISNIHKARFPYKDLIDVLESNSTVSKYCVNNNLEPGDIASVLFDFSVIGTLNNNRWIFKYKDTDLQFSNKGDIIVHYGLSKKLRVHC